MLTFVAGLAFLILGAEALVRGASRLAAALGVSPLVIGLTVVAFGTSAPEFAVSSVAALSGQSGIAVGNVVGSNIFNVLFILGASALIAPLVVAQRLVRLDVPLMIGLSAVVLVFSLDGSFSRAEGLALVAGLALYVWFLVRQSRRESGDVKQEYARGFGVAGNARRGMASSAIAVAGGLVLLVLGSRWLVESEVAIARRLGVSELVIGLTIVAAGTSLPEVVTSIVASIRKEPDIAVGNVVGSNIFNIMGVLGFASSIAPRGIEVSGSLVRFDIPIMIVVSLACLPIFFTGSVISRAEGAVFLGYYGAYTTFLVLAATRSTALPGFGAVLGYFVIPLTFFTLSVVALRERRADGGRRSSPR